MENNINVSALAQNIADQCNQFEQSQEYKDMIQAAVRKLYTSAIDNVFLWGDFPDRVKKALKNAMPANIEDFIDLAKYNTLMAKTIEDTWSENAISENASEATKKIVLDQIKSLDVPKFVLLSELMEAYIESNESEAAENHWERPDIFYQESDTEGYWYLGLDTHKDSTSWRSKDKTHHFQYEQSLSFSPCKAKNEKIEHEGNSCFLLYSGKLDSDVLGKAATQFYSSFDKLVAALYYGNAYLVFDDVDFDSVCYPNNY